MYSPAMPALHALIWMAMSHIQDNADLRRIPDPTKEYTEGIRRKITFTALSP